MVLFGFPQPVWELDYWEEGVDSSKGKCMSTSEWLWCPPSQWTLIALFWEIKWPGHKADYSPIHKNALFFQV
jgi:hypothetical protein